MSTRWNDIFQLPEAALPGSKRVPKTMLTVQAVAKEAHLLHKCFPNPTVIMQEVGEQICVSVSLTRKSHAEWGATMIERIESTGLFDEKTSEWQPFLDSLAFGSLPQKDLFAYLNAMSGNEMLARSIDALGFYPQVEADEQGRVFELVRNYDVLQREVCRLWDERNKPGVTLNESARLRMKIRKAKAQRDAALNEIMDLCHSRKEPA